MTLVVHDRQKETENLEKCRISTTNPKILVRIENDRDAGANKGRLLIMVGPPPVAIVAAAGPARGPILILSIRVPSVYQECR